MLQTRRAAVCLVQRPFICPRRGYADPPKSTSSGGVREPSSVSENASAGEVKPTYHAPQPEPANEDLGRGFYISIAALALSFALYKYSRSSSASNPDKQPLLTRLLDSYSWFQDEFAKRNTLHTAMVEQAAEDRNLFQSSPWTHHTELKFPEVFNTGSPYNVPAGHSMDLGAVIAHYEKQNTETEQKRIERVNRQAVETEKLAQIAAQDQSRKTSVLQKLGLSKPGS